MDSWEENNVRIIRHVSYENFYSKSIQNYSLSPEI